ncbi:hypothetical protein HanRHA438_Chr14g0674881 [Helianthus annuus]|nr:hypothetical protein HanIR_Chr14g0720221 [Helianthus annuus]KAJ0855578.1 hypothetical protein HanRHA438_Chr14g0674881 [Helianthus annuus]
MTISKYTWQISNHPFSTSMRENTPLLENHQCFYGTFLFSVPFCNLIPLKS